VLSVHFDWPTTHDVGNIESLLNKEGNYVSPELLSRLIGDVNSFFRFLANLGLGQKRRISKGSDEI